MSPKPHSGPRLVDDFNYGGLQADEGRVYLKPDTLADLASAGFY